MLKMQRKSNLAIHIGLVFNWIGLHCIVITLIFVWFFHFVALLLHLTNFLVEHKTNWRITSREQEKNMRFFFNSDLVLDMTKRVPKKISLIQKTVRYSCKNERDDNQNNNNKPKQMSIVFWIYSATFHMNVVQLVFLHLRCMQSFFAVCECDVLHSS